MPRVSFGPALQQLAGRYGGDEFVALLDRCEQDEGKRASSGIQGPPPQMRGSGGPRERVLAAAMGR